MERRRESRPEAAYGLVKEHNRLVRALGHSLRHRSPLHETKPGSQAALKADLSVCRLCQERGKKVVLPEGTGAAKVVIVGESPGREEAAAGRPFVGTAGRRLMKVLDQLGLARSEVYLTNAVKCYLERTPKASEIEACRPWLMRELALVGKGKRVVALGKVAVRALAGRKFVAAPHPVARVSGVSERIRRAIR